MLRFALFFAGLLSMTPALAQKADVYADRGGAIRGYDPVGYFTAGRPVKGSPQFSHQWRGATWHFASAENRDRFAAAPEKFAPQYGGYCAYGVSRNKLVEIDVDAFQIIDRRLILQYNKGVRNDFNKDQKGNLEKAEKNWTGLVEKRSFYMPWKLRAGSIPESLPWLLDTAPPPLEKLTGRSA